MWMFARCDHSGRGATRTTSAVAMVVVLFGLIFSVVPVDARRSWQHVGRQGPFGPSQFQSPPMLPLERRAVREPARPRFLNAKTAPYQVNGTGIPLVRFDVGESYAGSLSIHHTEDSNSSDGSGNSSSSNGNGNGNGTRVFTENDESLFFWYFPSAANEKPPPQQQQQKEEEEEEEEEGETEEEKKKEILIWLNGGPGCSSFEGFLQENGPFLWQYGTYEPVANPWSWHRLTNVVWVDQPIGTGYATGNATAKGEEDVAQQFLGFWRNLVDLFDLQGYDVYVTGESYAGRWCSYIAAAMIDQARYEQGETHDSQYYNLKGMMLYDPVIGDNVVQSSATVAPFVQHYASLIPMNASTRAHINSLHQSCGFADLMSTYLTYPPPQSPSQAQPPSNFSQPCVNLWSDVLDAAVSINPCFDMYSVSTTCPLLWDVLGYPGSIRYDSANQQPQTPYFDRADVKRAIHAPAGQTWTECGGSAIFDTPQGGSTSRDPIVAVLPRVVDATRNVLVGHGLLDMIIPPNGTLLALQNMTWGGLRGFQTTPFPSSSSFFSPINSSSSFSEQDARREEAEKGFYVPYHRLSTHDTIGAAADNRDPGLATMAAAGLVGSAHVERGLTFATVTLSGHMVPQYAPSAALRMVERLLGRVGGLNETEPFTIVV